MTLPNLIVKKKKTHYKVDLNIHSLGCLTLKYEWKGKRPEECGDASRECLRPVARRCACSQQLFFHSLLCKVTGRWDRLLTTSYTTRTAFAIQHHRATAQMADNVPRVDGAHLCQPPPVSPALNSSLSQYLVFFNSRSLPRYLSPSSLSSQNIL